MDTKNKNKFCQNAVFSDGFSEKRMLFVMSGGGPEIAQEEAEKTTKQKIDEFKTLVGKLDKKDFRVRAGFIYTQAAGVPRSLKFTDKPELIDAVLATNGEAKINADGEADKHEQILANDGKLRSQRISVILRNAIIDFDVAKNNKKLEAKYAASNEILGELIRAAGGKRTQLSAIVGDDLSTAPDLSRALAGGDGNAAVEAQPDTIKVKKAQALVEEAEGFIESDPAKYGETMFKAALIYITLGKIVEAEQIYSTVIDTAANKLAVPALTPEAKSAYWKLEAEAKKLNKNLESSEAPAAPAPAAAPEKPAGVPDGYGHIQDTKLEAWISEGTSEEFKKVYDNNGNVIKGLLATWDKKTNKHWFRPAENYDWDMEKGAPNNSLDVKPSAVPTLLDDYDNKSVEEYAAAINELIAGMKSGKYHHRDNIVFPPSIDPKRIQQIDTKTKVAGGGSLKIPLISGAIDSLGYGYPQNAAEFYDTKVIGYVLSDEDGRIRSINNAGELETTKSSTNVGRNFADDKWVDEDVKASRKKFLRDLYLSYYDEIVAITTKVEPAIKNEELKGPDGLSQKFKVQQVAGKSDAYKFVAEDERNWSVAYGADDFEVDWTKEYSMNEVKGILMDIIHENNRLFKGIKEKIQYIHESPTLQGYTISDLQDKRPYLVKVHKEGGKYFIINPREHKAYESKEDPADPWSGFNESAFEDNFISDFLEEIVNRDVTPAGPEVKEPAPAAEAAPAPEPPAAPEENPKIRARLKYTVGTEFFKKAQYRAAASTFEEAYKLDPSPIVLYNIGRAYEELGEPATAKAKYEEYRSKYPEGEDRAEVTRRTEALDKVISPETTNTEIETEWADDKAKAKFASFGLSFKQEDRGPVTLKKDGNPWLALNPNDTRSKDLLQITTNPFFETSKVSIYSDDTDTLYLTFHTVNNGVAQETFKGKTIEELENDIRKVAPVEEAEATVAAEAPPEPAAPEEPAPVAEPGGTIKIETPDFDTLAPPEVLTPFGSLKKTIAAAFPTYTPTIDETKQEITIDFSDYGNAAGVKQFPQIAFIVTDKGLFIHSTLPHPRHWGQFVKTNSTPDEIRNTLLKEGGLLEEIAEKAKIWETYGENIEVARMKKGDFLKACEDQNFVTKLSQSTGKSESEIRTIVEKIRKGKKEIDDLDLLQIEKKYFIAPKLRPFFKSKETLRKEFHNIPEYKIIALYLERLGLKDQDEAADVIFKAYKYNEEYINFNNIFRALEESGYDVAYTGMGNNNVGDNYMYERSFVRSFKANLSDTLQTSDDLIKSDRLPIYNSYLAARIIATSLTTDETIKREEDSGYYAGRTEQEKAQPAGFVTAEKYEETLNKVIVDAIKRAKGSPIDIFGQSHRSVFEKRTLQNAHEGDLNTVEIEKYFNAELVAEEILALPQRKIKVNGTEETVEIFKLEGEVKVINEAGLRKYITYLMNAGKERADKISRLKDEKQSYRQAMEKDFKNRDLILANDDVTKLEGYKYVESVLTKVPFSFDKKDVPKLVKIIYSEEKDWGFVGSMKSIRFSYSISSQLHKNLGIKEKNLQAAVERYEELNSLNRKPTPQELEQFSKLTLMMKSLKALSISLENLKTDKGPLVLAEGPTLDSIKGMNDEQIDYLNQGLIAETIKDNVEQKEKFSQNPAIQKIQKEALKKGYPKEYLDEIEPSVVVGLYAAFSQDGFESGGGGIAIPIGHGFSVGLGLSTEGVSAGMGFYGEVYKTSEHTGGMALGAGLNFGENITPGVSALYVHQMKLGKSEVMSDNMKLYMLAGPVFSPGLQALALGVGIGYDEKAEIKQNQQEFLDKFTDVENATTIEKKAEALKKHPEFAGLSEDIANVDLVSLYEDWKEVQMEAAVDEAAPSIPITKVGLGLTVGSQFGPALAIEFRIGSRKIYKLSKDQSQKKAEVYSEVALREYLTTTPSEDITFYSEESGDIYINAQGQWAIAESPETSSKTVTGESAKKGLENVKAKFKEIGLELNTETTELAGIKYHEIKVVDPDKRDIEVYPDVNSGLKMRKENGHIYLRAGFENIVALRRNFRYFAPKTLNGASRISVIVLTTKERTEEENFSMKEVTLESPEYLGKIYEKGRTTLWETERGQNYIGATKYNISGKGAKVPEAPAAELKEERIANIPATEFREIERIQGENKRHFTEGVKETDYQSLLLRDGFAYQIRDIYKKIATDLKKGNPDIGDTTGIIEKINENIGDTKMNTKEANEAQRLIQNEYFINLWERPNKAAIVRRFENNNRIILEKVLLPAFEKAVRKLGVSTSAMDLVTQVNAAAVDKFKAKITEYEDGNGAIKTKDHVRAFIEKNQADIPEGMLAKTGTTNRGTKGGRFTTYTSSFQAVENGLILEPTQWPLDSDVGKVLQEILNPTPSIENAESLIDNPFVMQLLTTKAAGIEMGVENYEEISRFYRLTNSEQRNELASPSAKLQEAVTTLETLVKRIKEAQAKGETNIVLKNGADLSFDITKAQTASYIVCGNHTLLLSQPRFKMKVKSVKRDSVAAAEDNAFIKPDVANGVDVWSVAAGIAGAPEEKDKPTGRPVRKLNRPKPGRKIPSGPKPRGGNNTGGPRPRGGAPRP